MKYLSAATQNVYPDFKKVRSGLFGCHIPICVEQDLPWFTKKLQGELRHASGSRLYHWIVVGGMKVSQIDKPLLEASKSYRKHSSPNVEIVIVAPAIISAETISILEKKGIATRLVNPPE